MHNLCSTNVDEKILIQMYINKDENQISPEISLNNQ